MLSRIHAAQECDATDDASSNGAGLKYISLAYLHLMKQIFILFLFSRIAGVAAAQEIIPLYKGDIPNYRTSVDEEKSVVGNDSILRIQAVQKPTLTVYLPAKEKANGTAVIICPGGGYGILAFKLEGIDVAKKFNEWGVTAFVLKYRIPNDKWMMQKETGPLQDAQRGIQLVRENADRWNIDTSRIGIMGFSAGGHLASTAATHFNKNYIDNPGKINLRPDFQLLLYPVISFADSITHRGSKDNLIGKTPSEEMTRDYSNELQITATSPPAFLVHAADDKAVNPLNSIFYYQNLLKNKISAELHIYERGGHGFGLNNKTTKDLWMDRLHNWMDAKGWLTKK
ncbi:MAG: alpha/beta hydrolase [Chitinophagaceae bacterium]